MVSDILHQLLFLVLHLDGGASFPPPLPAKEEREYVRRMESGDKHARDVLIERNLRLVAHIIKKYYTTNTENDELLSIGTVGLIKAVNTFSADKGTRLATYASRCIENEILMYFRAKKKSALDVSLEDPIEHDGDGNPLTLMEVLAEEDDVMDRVLLKNNTKKLYRFIREIEDPRERNILILRYGLGGMKPMTQSEIAKQYGISRSYVSRIETKSLKKLRKRFESDI